MNWKQLAFNALLAFIHVSLLIVGIALISALDLSGGISFLLWFVYAIALGVSFFTFLTGKKK